MYACMYIWCIIPYMLSYYVSDILDLAHDNSGHLNLWLFDGCRTGLPLKVEIQTHNCSHKSPKLQCCPCPSERAGSDNVLGGSTPGGCLGHAILSLFVMIWLCMPLTWAYDVSAWSPEGGIPLRNCGNFSIWRKQDTRLCLWRCILSLCVPSSAYQPAKMWNKLTPPGMSNL